MVVQRFAKTTLPPISERVCKSYKQGLSPARQMCSPKMRNFYNCRNTIGIPLQRQPTFEVVSHPLFNCGLCHLQERNSPPVVRLRFQSGGCRQKVFYHCQRFGTENVLPFPLFPTPLIFVDTRYWKIFPDRSTCGGMRENVPFLLGMGWTGF